MADTKSETGLVNQVDFVLQNYLDQLLVGATDTKPESAARSEAGRATQEQTQPFVSEVAEPVVSARHLSNAHRLPRFDPECSAAPTKPVFSEIIPPPPLPEIPVVDEQVVTPEKENGIDEPGVDNVNDLTLSAVKTTALNWQSSQGIDCLIFKVAGLKLAIPLPLLGGVHNVTDKVTPLFGQARWSLGVWQGDTSKLTIIDSAQLIMPERNVSLNDAGYGFFIQLDRSPWALACQEICDTVTLVNDSIKWRGDSSKRPWLAGTVISEMCALLDVPGILKLLEDNRRIARRTT